MKSIDPTPGFGELLTKRDEAIGAANAEWHYDLPQLMEDCDTIQCIADEITDASDSDTRMHCFTRS